MEIPESSNFVQDIIVNDLKTGKRTAQSHLSDRKTFRKLFFGRQTAARRQGFIHDRPLELTVYLIFFAFQFTSPAPEYTVLSKNTRFQRFRRLPIKENIKNIFII